MSSPVVRVLFVDADTDAPIAGSELSPEQLPESFEPVTRVSIHSGEYLVVGAEPDTRVAIAARGSVKIRLRKVVREDPQRLRYSLPTIARDLPLLGEPAAAGALRVRGDDWCQIEFWPLDRRASLADELAQVRAVYAECGDATGFDRIHQRQALPAPMRGSGLRVGDLAAFGPAERRGLAAEGLDGTFRDVLGGFAFAGAAATLYGVSSDGVVDAMAWLLVRPPLACVHRL